MTLGSFNINLIDILKGYFIACRNFGKVDELGSTVGRNEARPGFLEELAGRNTFVSLSERLSTR